MIRPLRRRHLWLVAGVAAIAAPLYLAALAARPAPVVEPALPDGLAEPLAATMGEGVELPTTPPIYLRPLAGGAVEATADGFVEGADLLLYWAPAEGSRSLAEAHLLGALRGGERQQLRLPAEAAGVSGVLVLYSLGHGDEVAYAPWPTTPGDAP
ncbi:MAG: hypothetical protein ACE5EG_01665 [Thermoanaerobaculia bacterium]